MVDYAIEILLENLKKLLPNHAHLINDKKSEIENLDTDLGFLRDFLRDKAKKRREYATIKEMVKEIQDVVHEIEDIIDAFVTNANVDKRHKSSSTIDLHTIAKKVEGIKHKVQRRKPLFRILSDGDEDNHEKLEPQAPRKKDVVGFEDVMHYLINCVTQETDYFDIISVIGMLGLGKSTMAWKIFNDPQIIFEFAIRVWVCISEEFTDREIFLYILKEFTTINGDILAKKDHELADMVAAYLERGSFLIVMDDVRETADWDRLRVALPKDNTRGKVLITSRTKQVGYYVNRVRSPYYLRFLTFEESWELFRLEALGKLDCPSGLEDAGRKIAEDCKGLPLSIVAIGGILATRYTDTIATRIYWEKVSKHVSSYLCEMGPANRMRRSISLSYDKLPYHLHPCFLYFGLFPNDYEIPVSKLIRMWIGEGFVRQELDCSLEETAEKYLEDLININWVKTKKFKPDGKVKTCQVQDTLRDFCRIEAANEHFLQEIKKTDEQFALSTSDILKCRRLSLHSNFSNVISSKRPFGPSVCSFLCFSKDISVVSPENSRNIFRASKMLRVLEVLPLEFIGIDSDMYNLLHLRYIALSSHLSVLPPKFNQFWNIQTLIVNTTCRTLKVEADIWKMNQLRHFKTNASAMLLKSSKSRKISTELQTLSFISVESCTEDLSDRAPNLKTLGIRGQLSLLFDRRNGSFDSLGKMRKLGKLKLINDTFRNPHREGGLVSLPKYDRFPPSLTSLTLCATFLSWEHMSTLGLLERLEVLRLKDNAFIGSTWAVIDGGFQRLEVLHIEETDLAVWKASSHHYPKLRSLVLKNCEKLSGIPAELADIPSLENLELHTCISVAKSSMDIWHAKEKTWAQGTVFRLSVYPPME